MSDQESLKEGIDNAVGCYYDMYGKKAGHTLMDELNQQYPRGTTRLRANASAVAAFYGFDYETNQVLAVFVQSKKAYKKRPDAIQSIGGYIDLDKREHRVDALLRELVEELPASDIEKGSVFGPLDIEKIQEVQTSYDYIEKEYARACISHSYVYELSSDQLNAAMILDKSLKSSQALREEFSRNTRKGEIIDVFVLPLNDVVRAPERFYHGNQIELYDILSKKLSKDQYVERKILAGQNLSGNAAYCTPCVVGEGSIFKFFNAFSL